VRVAGALAFAVAAHQAAAQPSAATGKTVVYRTQAGDTLYDVAARYLQGRTTGNCCNGSTACRHRSICSRHRAEAAGRGCAGKLTARIVAVQGRSAGPAALMRRWRTTRRSPRASACTGANGFVTLELATARMSLPPDSQLELKTLRRTVLTACSIACSNSRAARWTARSRI
jgi:hypothetical protein